MLHSELIYNIKNIISKGVQSDDLKISDRQIAFIINYYRAKLLKQDAQRHHGMSLEDVQDLGKVELIQADEHECCEINACVLRTKHKLPATIELRSTRHGLTFVGTYKGKAFQETSYNRSQFDSFAPYTGKMTKWYIKGRYLYIVNPVGLLSFINVQGLFEDPLEANKFRTCDCPNEEVCQTGYDYEYPLSAMHVDTIVKLMLQTELSVLLGVLSDNNNNAKDELSNVPR
jgi:hypothetical protein